MKKAVISYNCIDGVSLGRVEVGNVITYSGDWAWEIYGTLRFLKVLCGDQTPEQKFSYASSLYSQQKSDAEQALSEVQEMLSGDIDNIEEFFVYVGVSAAEGAKALIEGLVSQGKTVHMIACDCSMRAKQDLASKLGIDIIWANCGGVSACGRIVKEFAHV